MKKEELKALLEPYASLMTVSEFLHVLVAKEVGKPPVVNPITATKVTDQIMSLAIDADKAMLYELMPKCEGNFEEVASILEELVEQRSKQEEKEMDEGLLDTKEYLLRCVDRISSFLETSDAPFLDNV